MIPAAATIKLALRSLPKWRSASSGMTGASKARASESERNSAAMSPGPGFGQRRAATDGGPAGAAGVVGASDSASMGKTAGGGYATGAHHSDAPWEMHQAGLMR